MANANVNWKKRILVPLWVIRILLMLLVIVIYALALGVVARDNDEYTKPAIGVVVIFMLMIVAVLLMDVLAIVLFLRDALKPKTFLILNVVQTSFWAGVLLLDIVAIAKDSEGRKYAYGIAFTVFVFLTFVALLIYASVQFHRVRKQAQRGHYAPTLNPGMPAPGYHPPSYGNVPYPQQQGTVYYSQSGHSVELSSTHTPYQSQGPAADYYNGQGVKPAQMV
ncbi:hypothetical protein CC78DRAFT_582329 [Lojkania enalia]|uniref:MARVEL domain-containing protein n=1 Tax=Lojkania enalia TaxID=147567 RepID=A0A9P4N522_9PLEO|nr:hypothetical protein CC78DRAFT_582329 [Didymosphaeria enalia]